MRGKTFQQPTLSPSPSPTLPSFNPGYCHPGTVFFFFFSIVVDNLQAITYPTSLPPFVAIQKVCARGRRGQEKKKEGDLGGGHVRVTDYDPVTDHHEGVCMGGGGGGDSGGQVSQRPHIRLCAEIDQTMYQGIIYLFI